MLPSKVDTPVTHAELTKSTSEAIMARAWTAAHAPRCCSRTSTHVTAQVLLLVWRLHHWCRRGDRHQPADRPPGAGWYELPKASQQFIWPRGIRRRDVALVRVDGSVNRPVATDLDTRSSGLDRDQVEPARLPVGRGTRSCPRRGLPARSSGWARRPTSPSAKIARPTSFGELPTTTAGPTRPDAIAAATRASAGGV